MGNTIRDVASRAGVSIATVSRVLNKTAQVKQDKRERVIEAIEALGYTPNQLARSLVQKKTGGVGVILPAVGGEFFSEFLHGVDVTTRDKGYFLLISASHGSMEELKVVLQGLQHRVDGLIILSPVSDGRVLRPIIPTAIPVIIINVNAMNEPCNTINFDNYNGAFLATAHLLERGHRRIAVLKGPAHAYDAKERLRGYREALRSYDIIPTPGYELEGDYSPSSGYHAAGNILQLDPRPTAIFCANDQSAIALMGALQNAGMQIPQDISIVGFDDIPGSKYTSPTLTTIRAGIRQLGILAIEKLLEINQKKGSKPDHQMLPSSLVIRQSTADYTPTGT